MSKVFTPPTEASTPPVDVDASGLARRLFRFYDPGDRGVNVYKMPDGTYTQAQPLLLSNPDPQNTADNANAPVITYYGGHSYTVDDNEATALTNAGYGAYLSPAVPDPNTNQTYTGAVPYGYSGQTASVVPVTPASATQLP